MRKLINIIALLLLFYSYSTAEIVFSFEHNPIINNTYSLNIELFEDDGFAIDHFVKLWEVEGTTDTLGKIYNHIDLGASLNFFLPKDKFSSKLSLGFGNGNYHSGGGDFYVLENAFAGFDMDYNFSSKLNLVLGGFACIHLRSGNGNRPLIDRYLWNFNMNYRISKVLQLGLLFEQYILTETKPNYKISYSKYVWAGPTFTLNLLQNRLKLQSSLGIDFIDYIDTGVKSSEKKLKEFYKIKIYFSF